MSSISMHSHFPQVMPPSTDEPPARQPAWPCEKTAPHATLPNASAKGGQWRHPPAETRHLPKYRCLAPSDRPLLDRPDTSPTPVTGPDTSSGTDFRTDTDPRG